MCRPFRFQDLTYRIFRPARAAESFFTDPAYIRYAAARRSGSESRFQLIDDTDLAGTIGLILAADWLSKS
jgi:hypothetical protein